MSSLDKVKLYLDDYGLKNDIMEFDVASSSVELAAIACKCKASHIAKTLSFKLKKQDKIIVVVMAGDASVDNKKYRHHFHEKGSMLNRDDTFELLGQAAGGVCPFALNDGVAVYLDISLKRFDYVYPACGSSNSAIRISIPDLENTSKYVEWVDVTKGWQSE
ncbi:YbaK/EbsC family protein [Mycoplasma sp. P36-A1]|uniref:YbaK/EbsC family protein n=1 Tax=Mycoplasma sp. P36-A1 TaxID=3252900 RepID=UPI003C305DBF